VSEVALLIGNSDGIGLAMTDRLLERGFAVTGVSRSPSPVSHQAYRHVVCDVSSADYGARLDAALPSDRIRLCVYCAGIGEHFAIDGLRQDVATLEVNLIGLARTVERVLPRMVADGPAVLAGLSSLADVAPSRDAPAYAASKAGMTYYLEGLAGAVRSTGVAVVNVRLGFVDTKMAKSPWKPWMIGADEAAERTLRSPLQGRPTSRVNIPRRAAAVAIAVASVARSVGR
jgi:NAD(P)-dependent dehydrogenase (short-subunit alcohol dehydrogenase family)